MEFEIRRLTKDDAEAYRELRLEMLLKHPEYFGSSYEEEVDLELAFFEERIEKNVIIGAFISNGLVGMTGLYRNERLKMRHVASVWGVYVTPSARGKGLAKKLFFNLMVMIREDFPEVVVLKLSVNAENHAAYNLYARMGFQEYGIEKKSLKVGDVFYDEILMMKELE